VDTLFPKKHQYGDTDTIFLIKSKNIKANEIVVSLMLCHLLENGKERQMQ
jgi:hypothetical protein